MSRILPLLLSISFLFSQYYTFGKNKVQYKRFHWKVLETRHFKIYNYEGEENLSRFAGAVLENYYKKYSKILNVDIEDKTPVIIYRCQNDFEQTNVILDLIEEGVGGFTEVFKNRVVVPFTGSYDEFRHVLAHELVHVFQYNILFKGFKSPLSTASSLRIPLWVMEGMAEYLSQGWDKEADIYIKDLVINDKILTIEKLSNVYGYIDYKEGQAIYRFIDEMFGQKKIGQFFHSIKFNGSLESSIKKTFNMPLEEFDRQFILYLKKLYYPEVKDVEIPWPGKRLTNHEEEGSYFNIASTISPDGSLVAAVSDRGGYSSIYLYSVATGKRLKKLITAEKTPSLENIHLLKPGLDFSPDGKKIVFSARSTKGDVIHILNVRKKKIVKTIKPGLDAIYKPKWSPDGKKIVFTGLKDGKSDIYIYELGTGQLHQITDDYFDDHDPDFYKKGIVFVSDRNDKSSDTLRYYGSYAVFVYENGVIRRITPYLGYISDPHFINDTSLTFVTNYKNSFNLVLYNTSSKKFYLVTDYVTGIKTPDWTRKNDKLVLSLLWDGGWDIYVLRNPLDSVKEVELASVPFKKLDLKEVNESEEENYKMYFTADWVTGTVQYSTISGFAGMFAISVSDELGDNRFVFYSDLTKDISNSDFELDYLYLPRRTDLGLSFYQFWSYYIVSNYEFYVYKTNGLAAQIWYPLDKFKRFEFGLGMKRIYYYHYLYPYEYPINVGSIWPAYASAGFTFDNVLYTYLGPLSGTRYHLEYDKVFHKTAGYQTAFFDFRHYLRITKRSALATRIIYGTSSGQNPQYFYLGGPGTLRGYDYFSFGGTNLFLANIELRVPFIDILKMAFPLPLEIDMIRGALFFDIGATWDKNSDLKPFTTDSYGFKLNDLKADIGFSIRLNLGIGILMYNVARPTNFREFTGGWLQTISIGEEF